ncbi:jg25271, partial [Pararge aegeria aegeria]
GVQISTFLTVQAAKVGNKIYASKDQIKNFSDESISGVICNVCPDLWDKIKRSNVGGVALPFTEQSRAFIYIPLNKEVAANMILAFFNSTLDPLDKIREVISSDKEGFRSKAGRLLTTYYLCCIKYLTDIDMTSIASEDERCRIMIDDLQAISNKAKPIYMNMKTARREIQKEVVAFHAVYGAYVMCRPVATKRSFREWVSKRYSSFLSSIQYTPEANVSLPIQEGGTHVNETVVERSVLRKIIYALTKVESEDIVISAIKTHVRFLTSLSDMTTYSLINQVINQGGAIICLSPLAGQVSKYARERTEVRSMMERENIPVDDIVYLHLVKPNYQCFRSSEYPDLVKTAQIDCHDVNLNTTHSN